jgi:prepilin peptidase CpaA
MHPIVWWATFSLVTAATATDIYNRRIPNWLVAPFLAAGVISTTLSHGIAGLGESMAGVAVAVAVTGFLCWLRGMGMGDLKLCAAVGAWIGPTQMGMALIATGLAGGAMAVIWAACNQSLNASLDGSSDLLWEFRKSGLRPHSTLTLDNAYARTMPYAPAIAVGTIFSFLTN